MIGEAQLLAFALRSIAVLVVAGSAAWVVARRGGTAAMKRTVWLLAIVALLALPMLLAVVAPLPLKILPVAAPMLADRLDRGSGGGPPVAWLVIAYGAGLLAVAARVFAGSLRPNRLWRRSLPNKDLPLAELSDRLAAEMGLRGRVALRLSPELSTPVAWNGSGPRVLLPCAAPAWSGERQTQVLIHEFAHLARHDSTARLAAAIACAMYWFNPGVWLAARALRLAQEQAADDQVLVRGGEPAAYAHLLLAFARQGPDEAAPAVCSAAPERTHLERRIGAIVRPAPRGETTAQWRGGAIASGAVVAIAVAAAMPVARGVSAPWQTARALSAAPQRTRADPGGVRTSPRGPVSTDVARPDRVRVRSSAPALAAEIEHRRPADAPFVPAIPPVPVTPAVPAVPPAAPPVAAVPPVPAAPAGAATDADSQGP